MTTHEEINARTSYKYLVTLKARHWDILNDHQQRWLEDQIAHFKKHKVFKRPGEIVVQNMEYFIELQKRLQDKQQRIAQCI